MSSIDHVVVFCRHCLFSLKWWIVAVLVFALSLPFRASKIPLHWQPLEWTVFRKSCGRYFSILYYLNISGFLFASCFQHTSTMWGALSPSLTVYFLFVLSSGFLGYIKTISLQPSRDLWQWYAPCTFKLFYVYVMETPSTIIDGQS